MMASVASIQDKTPPGRELMNQAGALLGVALDQDTMLQSLREQEELLRRAALYDHLTGLPNRSLFLDRLDQAARRVQRQPDHRIAVLFLDLDGFKAVNDTLGHEAGDQLLTQAGQRISAELRRADTAARFGGDEFLVLIDGLTEDRVPAEVAARLQAAIDRPFTLGAGVAKISVSIGIAQPNATVFGAAGQIDVERLLRDADHAMYREKSFRRRNRPSAPAA
jgi:diguanylate cyclase (GGDEF)-like protein